MNLCFDAFSKDADGLLDMLLSPSDGLPAFQSPGSDLIVTAKSEVQLELIGAAQSISFKPDWIQIHPGKFVSRFTIPENCAPGIYDLRATNDNHSDTNLAAVHVLAEAPEVVAITSLASVADLAAIPKIESDIQVLIIPDSAKDFDSTLPKIRIPKPGEEKQFEARYGTLPRTLQIGDYSLLLFNPAETRADRIGDLFRLRRRHIADTWMIGISTRSPAELPFPSQMTLFDDSPLHAVISPLPGTDAENLRAWSDTKFFNLSEKNGPMTITLSPSKLTPTP